MDTDAPFSVKQYHSMKTAIELIVSIGVIPSLLPGVGVGMARLCPRASQLPQEEHLGYLQVNLLPVYILRLFNIIIPHNFFHTKSIHFRSMSDYVPQRSYSWIFSLI